MARQLAATELTPAGSDEVALVDLFRSPVICVPADDVSRLAPYIGSEFSIIAIDSAFIDELRSETKTRPFLSSPPCIVAILAVSAKHLAELKQARELFLAMNATLVPEPKLVRLGQPAEIVAAIATGISQTLVEQSKLISSQARETAKLRQQNEHLQNHFHSLEVYLDRRGEQPCEVAFTSAPVLNAIEDVRLRMAADQRLGQILPVASQGICGFGIYVESRGETTCQFAATLRGMEDGKIVGSWSLQADQLRRGWNTFALNSSVAGLRRTVRLELCASGTGAAPTLTLAAIQPVVRFQVWDLTDHQPISHRNLAIKVFAGLPGLMVADWFSSAAKDGGGYRERNLPVNHLSLVRQTGFNAPVDYPEVVYLADERAILCHPPTYGDTVAELPGVVPKGAVRVSAVGLLPNDQSQPIELCIRVVSADEKSDTRILAESVWTTVLAGQSVVLNAFVSEPPLKGASLELASRMKAEGNNECAWAKFKHISFALTEAD